MTNLPQLSSRALKALDVLADGGEFVERLERNTYTGRDQFRTRLLSGENHRPVAGIGRATMRELQAVNMLKMGGGNTSVSTYWKLNTGAGA